MLIVCPTCATSYDVELASLQPKGRQVRCVRCRTIWHAAASRAEELTAAADALAPAYDAAEVAVQSAAGEPGSHLSIGDPAEQPDAAWADETADEVAAEALGSLNVVQSADGNAFPEAGAAEPVAVDAPSIAPGDFDDSQHPTEIDADDNAEMRLDVETVAAQRSRRGSRRTEWRWPLSRLQSGIMALVLLDAIIIGWRANIVRVVPQTASFFSWLGIPVNLRGLDLANIATATERQDGVPILVVEGNIVNDARKIVDVPRLIFAVRNAAKQEIYSWTAVPSRTTLPPGESVAFHSRLASPPPDSHDVLVRFVNRRDIIAGDH